MYALNKHNTIDDVLTNKELKRLYNKTRQIFTWMCEKNHSAKCVFCGRKYRRSNFLSCKSCKQPNLLIKYGFVDSGRDSRYNGGY